MLTPAKTNPNYKSELERRKVDPISFGAAHDVSVAQRVADIEKQLSELEKQKAQQAEEERKKAELAELEKQKVTK